MREIIEKPVPLSEVIEQMQIVPDEATNYYRRSTGEFRIVFDSYAEMVEDGDLSEHLADWEQEELKAAEEVINDNDDGDYVALPSKHEIHEYSIMEAFCDSVADHSIASDLFDCISGKGAFRRFKDAIHRHSVEKQWYRFKDESYREIAREWCEENDISWKE